MENRKPQEIIKIKNIKPYRQTTPYSCLAACVLMIGNYFLPKIFLFNKDMEMEIYNAIKFDTYNFENGAKAIKFLIEQGFEVRYFLSLNKELIYQNPPPNFSKEEWIKLNDEFFRLLSELKGQSGLEIFEDTSVGKIIDELKEGRLVICEIQPPSSVITHSIIIRGIERNTFLCLDPLSSNVYRRIHMKELDRMLNITYGAQLPEGQLYGRNFVSTRFKSKQFNEG